MTANPIRVAVNGYGNLGRGVEKSILAAPDMELVAIFTRRDPASLDTLSGKAVSIDDMADYQGKVDVCGGQGICWQTVSVAGSPHRAGYRYP